MRWPCRENFYSGDVKVKYLFLLQQRLGCQLKSLLKWIKYAFCWKYRGCVIKAITVLQTQTLRVSDLAFPQRWQISQFYLENSPGDVIFIHLILLILTSLLVFLSSNKFPSNFLPSCYPCLLYIFSWFSLVLKFSQFPPNLLHLILLIPLQLNTHLKFFQITSSDKFPNSPPACYHSYPSCAICCSAIFDAVILADDALADNELIIGRRNAINTKNNPNPLHITESLDAEKQSLEKRMNGNLPLA